MFTPIDKAIGSGILSSLFVLVGPLFGIPTELLGAIAGALTGTATWAIRNR